MMKKITAITLTMLFTASLVACANPGSDVVSTSAETTIGIESNTEASQANTAQTESQASGASDKKSNSSDSIISTAAVTSNGKIDASGIFTERDLTQSYDKSDAQTIALSDGKAVSITKAGVYILSGTANDVTVTVDAGDNDKVQLVLDGASITNSSAPAIYVKNADKVFVTTTESENYLSVTGTFEADGDTNTDAVIFSKDDLVLNGLGTLTVTSTDNGISCKDDLKITGGTINVTSSADSLEANDSIAISGGNITISSGKDGLHAENDEDDSKGYIYICGGTLGINASSDGIQGTTVVQIDGGKLDITASEGIEGTYIQINGGEISISASDDGINASSKSSSYPVTFEMNGGNVTVDMGAGDTDGVDSNGDIYINGGTISVNGQSTFDYDGTAQHNGGTIIVNGSETDEIPNQFMGGGPGGMGGGMDGGMGGSMGAPNGNMG